MQLTEKEQAVAQAAAKLGTPAHATLEQMAILARETGMTYGKAAALWERAEVRAEAANIRRRAGKKVSKSR